MLRPGCAAAGLSGLWGATRVSQGVTSHMRHRGGAGQAALLLGNIHHTVAAVSLCGLLPYAESNACKPHTAVLQKVCEARKHNKGITCSPCHSVPSRRQRTASACSRHLSLGRPLTLKHAHQSTSWLSPSAVPARHPAPLTALTVAHLVAHVAAGRRVTPAQYNMASQ
jgi:hypothetical protein